MLKDLQVRPVCYPLNHLSGLQTPLLILYFQGLVIPHERHRHLPLHMGGSDDLRGVPGIMVRATGEIVCLLSTVLTATPRGAEVEGGDTPSNVEDRPDQPGFEPEDTHQETECERKGAQDLAHARPGC